MIARLLFAAALLTLPLAAHAQDRIVLLGTAGGPPAHVDRSQPATVLEVDGHRYLIDAGENAGQQLVRAGVPVRDVAATFLTHLHWDHVLGLDYLMATGWMTGRNAPMPIWGPPGTARLIASETAALAEGEDIFRPQSPERPPLASLYPAHEATVGDTPRETYRDETVRVTAAANTHFAVVHAAAHDYGTDFSYSYRFDSKAGSVVFTGDTGPSPAVASLAKGADVLVTEVCDLASIRAALTKTQGPDKLDLLVRHMAEQHLSPEEVGKLAATAGVRKVVLTHFVAGPGFDPQSMLPAIRASFKGEIVIGSDLAVIPLGGE